MRCDHNADSVVFQEMEEPATPVQVITVLADRVLDASICLASSERKGQPGE